ncbi:MAG: hypothetical protein V7711_10935 [Pseudomonadales bacterium]
MKTFYLLTALLGGLLLQNQTFAATTSDSLGRSTVDARTPTIFSEQDIATIVDLYQKNQQSTEPKNKNKNKQKSLPPGLQKKVERGEELPPGWQKKLARGEVLDPAVRSSAIHLPHETLADINYDETVTDIIRVQDSVIKIMKGSGTIIDVIDLADVAIRQGAFD